MAGSADFLLNGKRGSGLDIHDRGLQYGDGLFETLEVYQSKPLFWDLHLQRLTKGCHKLSIPVPDPSVLRREAEQLIEHCPHGVLKLIVTRGCGGRGYRPPENPEPTRLLSLHPWPDYPEQLKQNGVCVRFCQTPLGLNPVLAGLKHLNRLEQVLARSEWQQPDIHEGLMLNGQGEVIEGTLSNVFYFSNGILFTPAVDQCGVKGIVRDLIISLAERLSMSVRETRVLPEQLLDAEEIFLTNSVIGIWPVRQLADTHFTIGSNTRRLQAAYQQLWLQQVENA